LSDAKKTLPSSRVFLWLWILEDQEHLPNGRYFAFGELLMGSSQDQERLPNGRHFAFGELLGKAPQVTKGVCSWLGPSFVRVPSPKSRLAVFEHFA
jgi:hypothetical protein